MPPCAGCVLNVEEAQRGDADGWEWKDEEPATDAPDETASTPEADPDESSEDGTEAPQGEKEQQSC